MLQEKIVIKKV